MTTSKSWGSTAALLSTPLIEVHRIEVRPEMRCSWHCHERKWNAFAVLSGQLVVETERADGARILEPLRAGDFTAVRPGDYHRFTTGPAPAVALELYYPDSLSEDIIRRDAGGHISQEGA